MVKLQERKPWEKLFVMGGAYFADAWFVMLGLGVLHGHVHQVPAFGYWLTWVLNFFLGTNSAVRTPAVSVANAVIKS